MLVCEASSSSSSPSKSAITATMPSSERRRRPRTGRTILSLVAQTALAVIAILGLGSTAEAANVTSLEGTWSSGSGQVMTGLSFFNPIMKNFTIPPAGGISYSFTHDGTDGGGHFETSTFRFTSNASIHRCFVAALTWQHGTFTVNANGSLSLTPFAADGYVQVMDPCAATSTKIYNFNQFELIPYFYNYVEPDTGFSNIPGSAYAMQMYEDDGKGNAGSPKPLMFLVNRPPTMLPTVQLHQELLNSVGADG